MIIVIDTDTRKMWIDNILRTDNLQELTINNNTILKPNSTIANELAKYRGTYEYTGIVAEIQKWYYGKLVKSSWCATTISYFADKLGILSQLGGKNNNVYNMMIACQKASPKNFYTKDNLPSKILKDDILFMLWNGDTMTVNSSKHVTVAEYNSTGDTIFCIGGNQKDKVCTLKYERKYVYALFRPQY